MALDGATTSEAYREYVLRILVPNLRTGDIVIFDNLRAHHDPEALGLIHAAGAMTLPLSACCLPPRSESDRKDVVEGQALPS